MPTSKTTYEAFDGTEFDNEKDAEEYEGKVREFGVKLRENFLAAEVGRNYLRFIEPKLLELIKSYPDDEAWRIMRSLKAAQHQMQHNERGLPSEGYLYYFDDDDDECI